MSEYDDLFEDVIEDKPKRKRNEDPTTWADAWKAIGIFLGSVFVVSLLLSGINSLIMGDTMDKYFDITLNASSVQEFQGLFNIYMNSTQNPVFFIIYMAISMVLIVIGLFVVYGLLHVFATKVNGGEGTLRGLIVRANWWTTGVYMTYAVLNTIGSSFMIRNIVDKYDGVNIAASPTVFNEYSQYILSQSTFIYLVMLVTWLTWNVAVGFITAKNYEVSKNKGCVAMLLTNVTIVGLYCGCAFGIGLGIAGFVLAA